MILIRGKNKLLGGWLILMEINLLRSCSLSHIWIVVNRICNSLTPLERLGDETKMSTEASTNLYVKLDEVGPLAGNETIIEQVKGGMG